MPHNYIHSLNSIKGNLPGSALEGLLKGVQGYLGYPFDWDTEYPVFSLARKCNLKWEWRKFVKVHCSAFLRRQQKFEKISHLFWRWAKNSCFVKTGGRFFQILWPSHNIWTLRMAGFFQIFMHIKGNSRKCNMYISLIFSRQFLSPLIS